MPVNATIPITTEPIGILRKTPSEYVVVPNSDSYADGMYDLFGRKITDAPRKPLENSNLEDYQQTNGKSLRQNLFGGELNEPVEYDRRTDFLDSIIGATIGGRYVPIAVLSYGDDANQLDYFPSNKPESKRSRRSNDDLPDAKKVCK